jgi:hypothetical protein
MAISSEGPSADERLGEQSSLLFEALLGKTVERQDHVHPAAAQSKIESALGKIDGVVIGRLVGFDARDRFLVHCSKFPTEEPLVAVAMVSLSRQDIDKEVALSFIDGNPHQPVILGLLHMAAEPTPKEGDLGKSTVEIQRDDDRLLLSAEQEIVLRCGESSITLSKAGKIIIRGKYLLSRAEGVNRIKGGAVQIN